MLTEVTGIRLHTAPPGDTKGFLQLFPQMEWSKLLIQEISGADLTGDVSSSLTA